MSEAAFDNLFPNMLARKLLDWKQLKVEVDEICCWASAQRRNQGRSVVLRAQIGQRRDFKGTLRSSIDKVEAIIGLRSGGLPEAHRKKIFTDCIDLAVSMRDILYAFFSANPNTPDDKLHQMFVLGVQSWGWMYDVYAMDCKGTNVCQLGRLNWTKMPNAIETIACLEEICTVMTDIKATLRIICDKANDAALSNA
ncbi:hypothetical protein BC938DRAFT_483982 [Jimgerdemannia flammicorona]|uniref:Uncharacterized protein n=1 Tax=Jimgerdemannia flammicorona TaxID=994334 RepID=A0A433QVC9_9FUNG|nr:hypothetical protein BC938DRAFT_483982 [Jimgerdemannia flammicorona]